MKNLFAGVDSSTQSTKLIVIDFDSKTVVYEDSINYDKDLPKYSTINGVIQNLGEGVSESNPEMWIESLEILFKRLKGSQIPQQNIKAISVSGQQHGLVALDDEGDLTRKNSKLWNDFSTQEECDLLAEAVGGIDKMIADSKKVKLAGFINVVLAAKITPPNPAHVAPSAKAVSLVFVLSIPIAWHAISSSLSASHALPSLEFWSLFTMKIVIIVMSTIR